MPTTQESQGILRAFIESQKRLSQAFDRLLPARYRRDGNRDYLDSLVPAYLRKGITIYDVGGGKNPCLTAEKKRALEARVVGVDIDQAELNLAPEGAYDSVVCADIASLSIQQDADW